MWVQVVSLHTLCPVGGATMGACEGECWGVGSGDLPAHAVPSGRATLCQHIHVTKVVLVITVFFLFLEDTACKTQTMTKRPLIQWAEVGETLIQPHPPPPPPPYPTPTLSETLTHAVVSLNGHHPPPPPPSSIHLLPHTLCRGRDNIEFPPFRLHPPPPPHTHTHYAEVGTTQDLPPPAYILSHTLCRGRDNAGFPPTSVHPLPHIMQR